MKKNYILWQHKLMEIISFVAVAVAFGYAIYMYNAYSGEFVTHYNASGEADGFGSPGVLFIMPAIMLVVNALISLLAHFTPAESFNTPFKKNPKNLEGVMKYCMYTMTSVELIISLYMLYITITWGLQLSFPVVIELAVFIVVLAADIIYFSIKASKENNK